MLLILTTIVQISSFNISLLQVLTSLFTAEGCDPLILTKCMLAMLQNSYQVLLSLLILCVRYI